MPEGQIKTIFSGDASGLLREMERMVRKAHEYEKKIEETAKGHRSLSQAIAEQTGNAKDAFQQQLRSLNMIGKAQEEAIADARRLKAEWQDLSRIGMAAMPKSHWNAGALSGAAAETDKTLRMNRRVFDFGSVSEAIASQGGLPKEVLRDLDEIYEKQTRNNRELTKSSGLSASWGKSLMGVAASYIGIQQGIGWVHSALEEQNRLAEQSIGKLQTLAKAEARLFFNQGFDTEALNKARPVLQGLAIKYGVGEPQQLLETYSAMLSRYQGDEVKAMAATEQAARQSRHNPEAMTDIGGAIANIQLADSSVTAEQALAAFTSAGEVAPQVKDAFIAEYVTPLAVSGATYTQDKSKRRQGALESMAVAITLAKYKGDAYGRMSMTNANLLHESARRFFRDHPSLSDPGTPGARLRAISRMDLATREAFAESLGGDSAMAPVKEMMALGDEDVWQTYDTAMSKLSFDTSTLNDLDRGLSEGSPAMKAAHRAATQKARSFRNTQLESAQREVLKQQMRDAYAEAVSVSMNEGGLGSGWFTRRLRDTDILVGRAMSDSEYADTLYDQTIALRQTASTTEGKSAITEEAKAIREMAKELKALNESVSKNTQATEQNTAAAGDPNRDAPGANLQQQQTRRKNRP